MSPTNLLADVPGVLADAATPTLDRGRLSPIESPFSDELDEAARKQKQARESAEQLIASAFILPVLEEVRNSPFKTEMFSGGRAEEVFGQQLDVIFAERITQSAGFGLSEALIRQFDQSPAPGSQEPKVDLRG
ncbi:MAG: rod-binding protein [Planctomycetota bacterium]